MQKTKGKILIVDDNQEALIALEMYLGKHFSEIRTVRNPNLIPNLVSSNDFDVIILDMNFSAGISSGNEGLFWLSEILKIDPAAVVVFITAYGDIELAVKGIKKGAHDFITKPWENEKLLATVESAYKLRKSKLEIADLKNKQQHLSEHIHLQYKLFKGVSPSMVPVFETIDKVAKTGANILILGENGTGKEMIAREIHLKSNQDIFIPVDIASLPESLIESELFGYTRGAFTDARTDKPGRFELAGGGTLFLDEVGNIPIKLQTKILSALQSRSINRLGSNKNIPINFRLISATNNSLYNMVEEGSFREDLLYRINTIQIEIPPLRNRKEDIEGLTIHFLDHFGMKYKKEGLKLNVAAINKLQKYPWPGNIRELENLIEKAVIMAEGSLIKADDFQFYSSGKPKQNQGKFFSLAENEKIIIREAMRECNGNLSETADRLGITRATLYRKIKKYDL
ncbi:MAG: sigma-54 dependent transcriptional regulator [Bacteroidales bacterium]|nr:sigma-54 dependent transcriptional regulator [Bacteroidales bacterium]